MTGQRVARRYARALVELAEKANRVDTIGDEVERMAGLFDASPELRALMYSPGIAKGVKENVLNELLRRAEVSDLTVRFFRLLVDKDRLRYVSSITVAYRELADELKGRIRAKVRSAFALSHEEETALRKQLSAATGKEVILEIETDKTLLGGIRAQLGSSIWDGSVRNQLNSLREKLAGPA